MNKSSRFGSLLVAALLGSLTVSAVRAEEAAIAAPAAQSENSAFTGIWKVQDGKGRDFYITLSADGTAASSWIAVEDQRRNQKGTWALTDGKVVITWSNGWRETVVASEGGFLKSAFAPKQAMEDKPANTSPAVKVEAIPAP